MPSDPVRVLLDVTDLLDRLAVPYFLGGSLASSMLGEPRSTVDVDLVIALRSADVRRLVEGLGAAYYVDESAARAAVDRHASFNAIHQATILKVDFFVLGDSPFDRVQLDRRRRMKVQAGRLDLVHLECWAATLGLSDLLARALAESGIRD